MEITFPFLSSHLLARKSSPRRTHVTANRKIGMIPWTARRDERERERERDGGFSLNFPWPRAFTPMLAFRGRAWRKDKREPDDVDYILSATGMWMNVVAAAGLFKCGEFRKWKYYCRGDDES